ncbi:MAG: extracellular solute-binding protein [Clostridiales bacterium]|jgi:putative aldouronate transport system substrate-binding protein|nr:extracellular solute-binding protein [Clostridiales bacterium]
MFIRNARRFTAFFLAFAMLVLAAACSTNDPAPATAAPASAAAATVAPAASEPAPAEETAAALPFPNQPTLVPFESRVHITVPVYDRSKEGYPAVDDNYWTQYIQKEFGDKLNIDVEYVAIPRGDVMTKYSLLIAGNETPTIMMEYDYPKVAQWANDGAMGELDLNAFAATAPTYYQAMVDNNQLGYTDLNGKTYFALSERPYYNTTFTYATFVRKDWLDKVGAGVPKSYAEFTAAIDAIIAEGLTDKAPKGIGLPSAAYVKNFPFRDIPVDEKEWVMHSSLGTPGFSWYPTERLLRRQNAEFNKGYISSEYDLDSDTTGGTTQIQTDFINGKTFSYEGYMAATVDWLSAFYQNNPDAELAIASVYQEVEPGVVADAQIRADNPFGMIVGFSSKATDDEKKAAWMLMEWMLQPDVLYVLENGVEGVTFTLGADGLPVVDADYRGTEMLNHNNNIDMTCLVHASKKIGTIEQTIAAIAPKGLPQDFTQALIDNYYDLKAVADKGNAYSDPIFAVAIDSESEYSATLLSLWQEYSVALTKCKPEEFDALYADLSKKFLDAGYQEIIDERLEAYENGFTTKLPK